MRQERCGASKELHEKWMGWANRLWAEDGLIKRAEQCRVLHSPSWRVST